MKRILLLVRFKGLDQERRKELLEMACFYRQHRRWWFIVEPHVIGGLGFARRAVYGSGSPIILGA